MRKFLQLLYAVLLPLGASAQPWNQQEFSNPFAQLTQSEDPELIELAVGSILSRVATWFPHAEPGHAPRMQSIVAHAMQVPGLPQDAQVSPAFGMVRSAIRYLAEECRGLDAASVRGLLARTARDTQLLPHTRVLRGNNFELLLDTASAESVAERGAAAIQRSFEHQIEPLFPLSPEAPLPGRGQNVQVEIQREAMDLAQRQGGAETNQWCLDSRTRRFRSAAGRTDFGSWLVEGRFRYVRPTEAINPIARANNIIGLLAVSLELPFLEANAASWHALQTDVRLALQNRNYGRQGAVLQQRIAHAFQAATQNGADNRIYRDPRLTDVAQLTQLIDPQQPRWFLPLSIMRDASAPAIPDSYRIPLSSLEGVRHLPSGEAELYALGEARDNVVAWIGGSLPLLTSQAVRLGAEGIHFLNAPANLRRGYGGPMDAFGVSLETRPESSYTPDLPTKYFSVSYVLRDNVTILDLSAVKAALAGTRQDGFANWLRAHAGGTSVFDLGVQRVLRSLGVVALAETDHEQRLSHSRGIFLIEENPNVVLRRSLRPAVPPTDATTPSGPEMTSGAWLAFENGTLDSYLDSLGERTPRMIELGYRFGRRPTQADWNRVAAALDPADSNRCSRALDQMDLTFRVLPSGPFGDRVMARLEQFLTERADHRRAYAAAHLAEVIRGGGAQRRRAQAALENAIRHEDRNISRNAARVLGQFSGPREGSWAVRNLMGFLSNQRERDAILGRESGGMSSQDVSRGFADALTGPHGDFVRSQLMQIVDVDVPRGAPLRELVAAFEQQTAAIVLIGRYSPTLPRDFITLLVRRLEAPVAGLRELTLDALARFVEPHAAQMEPIIFAIRDGLANPTVEVVDLAALKVLAAVVTSSNTSQAAQLAALTGVQNYLRAQNIPEYGRVHQPIDTILRAGLRRDALRERTDDVLEELSASEHEPNRGLAITIYRGDVFWPQKRPGLLRTFLLGITNHESDAQSSIYLVGEALSRARPEFSAPLTPHFTEALGDARLRPAAIRCLEYIASMLVDQDPFWVTLPDLLRLQNALGNGELMRRLWPRIQIVEFSEGSTRWAVAHSADLQAVTSLVSTNRPGLLPSLHCWHLPSLGTAPEVVRAPLLNEALLAAQRHEFNARQLQTFRVQLEAIGQTAPIWGPLRDAVRVGCVSQSVKDRTRSGAESN